MSPMIDKRIPRLLAGIALGATLAACMPGGVVVGPTDLNRYTPEYAGLFAANGQLVLIGTAFGSESGTQAFADTAAKALPQGSMAGTPFTLTANTGNLPQSKNRVVVVIGGANAYDLCENPPPSGGQVVAGQPFSVNAASCNGSDRLASTSGRISDPVKGPDDPAVTALFQQLGAELFPMRNPDYDDPARGDWGF